MARFLACRPGYAFVFFGLLLIGHAPGVLAHGTLVFAAASLKDALDAQIVAYHSEYSDKITPVYASSSALARQIAAGAPAAIYISANVQWMDYLDKKGEIVRLSRLNLLGNTLVLVAPALERINKISLKPGLDLVDYLNGGRLAIGNPDHVPAGIYAMAALKSMGFWQNVEDRLARAENVRAALALVDRGETSLGIVYGSDAIADPDIRVIATFPEDSHPAIIYPAALVAPGTLRIAQHFLQFLQTDQAAGIFSEFGFIPLQGIPAQ